MLVAVFVLSLVVPLFVYVGPVRLTVYRIVLLLLFFPALFALLSGKAGRIRLPDICVILMCAWSSLSLMVVHGVAAMIETIGILWIETLGAYLIARCYIRTPEAFYSVVRLLFYISIVMLPFAVYETITAKNLILQIFSKIGPTYWDNIRVDKRMGFDRVQGPFAHQIHLGVFFLSIAGLVYYVLGNGLTWTKRVFQVALVAFVGATSLSSGPLVALMAQLNIILWDGVMKSIKQRWVILVGLSVLGFVIVDIISNRTPFHVVIEYLAFNKHTAYNRIRIWDFGTASIFAHPLFGIGFGDWARPSWMSDSADMFWILPAMRHGIPVWILLFAVFFSIFIPVALRRGMSDRIDWYRRGYLVSMFGMFMAGWTVHYWDVTYVFLFFLLGSGVWFLDWEDSDGTAEVQPDEPERTHLRFTRFEA